MDASGNAKNQLVKETAFQGVTRAVAMDCEMVNTTVGSELVNKMNEWGKNAGTKNHFAAWVKQQRKFNIGMVTKIKITSNVMTSNQKCSTLAPGSL